MCIQKVVTYPAPLAPEQFHTKLVPLSFDRWLPQTITMSSCTPRTHEDVQKYSVLAPVQKKRDDTISFF